MMSEEKRPPIGVTILGWFQIVAGAFGTALMTSLFVVGVFQGRLSGGVPLQWLLAGAAPIVLGIALGVGILKGRSWTCGLASLLYFPGWYLILGYRGYLMGPSLDWEGMALLFIAVGVAGFIVAIPIYIYLYTNSVRDYFGLGKRRRWKPIAAHLALGTAIALAWTFYVSNLQSDLSVSRLQRIGEARGTFEGDLEFMIDRLKNGNSGERISAAWALGRTSSFEAKTALLRAAEKDSNTDVRVNAVAALAAIGGEGAQETLLTLLEDEEERVQAAALQGLASAEYAANASRIGEVLLNGSDALRPMAADVLGRMRNREAVPALLQAAGDPLGDVRSRVAFALGRLRDRRAVPTLVGMLQDDGWEVRANAAQALGMIGDASARPALSQMLDNPNPQVRWAAEAAIGKLF